MSMGWIGVSVATLNVFSAPAALHYLLGNLFCAILPPIFMGCGAGQERVSFAKLQPKVLSAACEKILHQQFQIWQLGGSVPQGKDSSRSRHARDRYYGAGFFRFALDGKTWHEGHHQ
jgi:hypothetical protein